MCFSAPSFDQLTTGVHALVFLDKSTLSADFWNIDRLLSSLSVSVHFIEATETNAVTYQFSIYPQVRIFSEGNEINSFTGDFDSVIEGCLSCLKR